MLTLTSVRPFIVLSSPLQLLDARHGVKMADIEFFARLKEAFSATLPAPSPPSPVQTADERRAAKKAAKLRPKRTWKLQIVLTKCDLVERKVRSSMPATPIGPHCAAYCIAGSLPADEGDGGHFLRAAVRLLRLGPAHHSAVR